MAATPAQRSSYVKQISSATDGRGLSGKTRALMIAHAALESGWGLSKQAQRVHNHWNISAGGSWRGPVELGGDLEYAPGSTKPKTITQRWRAYKTDAEAVADYLKVLEFPRYLPARAALMEGDPEGFIRLLGPDRANERPPVGGYYTLPTNDYLRIYNERLAEVMRLVDEGIFSPPASNPPPICLP